MNPSARTGDSDLPVDEWRRIDSACDRFEAAWRAGGRPDPVPFLPEVSGPARSRLLRELLAIEVESRRRGGERPDPAEFVARFPDEVAVIDGVFTELGPLARRDTLVLRRDGKRVGASSGLTEMGTDENGANVAPAEIGPAALAALQAAGYEVVGELGRGGMGVVYLARNLALDRPCALKMILAGAHAGPMAAARFRVEAAAVARLRHPGIVQIHHVGVADGLPFLELEYLPGGNLETAMDGRPRPPAEAARLIEALARGISEAHRLGIVHRDLKPANILLDAGGQPKVADFGLAKILDSEDGLTRTNLVIGSPSYMAPEQAEGQSRSVGMAVDVYALGAILYELLTGRPPFRASTTLETLEQVKRAEPVPPSRLQPGLPRELETICLKCLEKSPGRRYATAEALREDLRRHLGGEPIAARPSAFWERGWKWSRRRPAVASAIVIAATAVCALLGGGLHYNAQLRDTNDRLQRAVAGALSAEERAQANARVADKQRDLALKALLELADGVQSKLRDSPATLGLKRKLLETAVAGLAEIARGAEEAAPDLARAVAHRKLADVYRQLGRYPEARHQLELSMKLTNDLAAETPDNPDVLESLGVADFQLAWLELLEGHHRTAVELSKRGVEACEAAVAIDPARPLAREYRIRNRHHLGQVYLGEGKLTEALSTFGTTLDLARRWAADEPVSVAAKDLIVVSDVKLGDAYFRLAHDWPSSRAHYLEAIEVGRQLVAAPVGRPYHQMTLAGTMVNFVEYATLEGRTAEARPFIGEAQRIANELVEADPDHLDHQILLAEVQAHASSIEGADANFAEAASRLRPAIELLRRLKHEGKLEGYPSYRVQMVQYWANDLTYFESAPRALEDSAFVLSQPREMAIRLLELRLKTQSRQSDWPGLVATARAACDMQATDAEALKSVAGICARCIKAIDDFPSAGASAGGRDALRRRCTDRGVSALSRAIDLGWNDVPYLAEGGELKPLRDHPGFRALIERSRSARTAK